MTIKKKYKIYAIFLLITIFFMIFGNRKTFFINNNNKNVNDNYNNNENDGDEIILPENIPIEKLIILHNEIIKKNKINNEIVNYNNNNSIQKICFIIIIILMSSLYLFLFINEKDKKIKQKNENKNRKDGYILLEDENFI
jgi:hypothetical protein